MARFISLIALLAVIILIGLLFYKVMIGFFVPVFLAAMLVVLFRPLHVRVLDRTGQRPRVAAGITTVLILLCVLLPLGLVVSAATLQGVGWVQQVDVTGVKVALNGLRSHLGLRMEHEAALRLLDAEIDAIRRRVAELGSLNEARYDAELDRLGNQLAKTLRELRAQVETQRGPVLEEQFEAVTAQAESLGRLDEDELGFERSTVDLAADVRSLKLNVLGGFYHGTLKEFANPSDATVQNTTKQVLDYIRPRILSLTTATAGIVVGLVIGGAILIVCVYFFLYEGAEIVKSVMALSPLDDRYEQELLLEFDRVTRAVVLATVLSALTQGLTAGIGYYFAGLPNLILLIMLTSVFAMVPFVGPAIVWVPACLYLAFFKDSVGAAIGLAVYGVLIVGTVDNLVKAVVLHGQSQLHPLLALLSVLGGVQALGPIGIVIGPMAVVLLQTSLGILQRELSHFEEYGLLGEALEGERARRGRLLRRKKKKLDAEAEATSSAVSADAHDAAEATRTGAATDVTGPATAAVSGDAPAAASASASASSSASSSSAASASISQPAP
jgi:predicted PurR-regulated permease PerM